MRIGWLKRKETEEKEPMLIPAEKEGMPVQIVQEGREGNGTFVDDRLITVREPYSIAAEQYRVLCTLISQMRQNRSSYAIAITSSLKSEGKSFTSLNLGISMAKDFDERVLLIEGDLKNPNLHEYLKRSPVFGLSDVLEGRGDFDASAIQLFDGRLSVLLAGQTMGNPSRLLSSLKMQELLNSLRGYFKYIIIDTPPIIPLADISIYAPLVDGILLVIKAGKTPRSIVKRALGSIPQHKIIGAVLNEVESNYSQYYYGTKYGY